MSGQTRPKFMIMCEGELGLVPISTTHEAKLDTATLFYVIGIQTQKFVVEAAMSSTCENKDCLLLAQAGIVS